MDLDAANAFIKIKLEIFTIKGDNSQSLLMTNNLIVENRLHQIGRGTHLYNKATTAPLRISELVYEEGQKAKARHTMTSKRTISLKCANSSFLLKYTYLRIYMHLCIVT